MKVIVPTTITDAMYVSGPPETDYSAYAAGTTYAAGNRVIRTSTHRVYESLIAGNLGNTPETSPTKWLDVAPTNKWAPFDNVIGTSCSLASPLTLSLSPGYVDSIALLDLIGTSLTVSMTSVMGGGTVYNQTISLESSAPADYYEYFFSPFRQRTSVVLMDLPPFSDGVITITLTGTGTVSVGLISVGLGLYIGDARYGAKVGITDYSTKSADAFGNTTIAKRPWAKRPSYSLEVAKSIVSYVFERVAALRGTPCVWVGAPDDPELSLLTVFGFLKDLQPEATYPKFALCSLEIEGMT